MLPATRFGSATYALLREHCRARAGSPRCSQQRASPLCFVSVVDVGFSQRDTYMRFQELKRQERRRLGRAAFFIVDARPRDLWLCGSARRALLHGQRRPRAGASNSPIVTRRSARLGLSLVRRQLLLCLPFGRQPQLAGARSLWLQVLQPAAGAAPSWTPRPITYDFFFSRPAFRLADARRWRLEPVVSSALAAGAASSWTPRPTYDFFFFKPFGGQTGSAGAWNCDFKCCSGWRGRLRRRAPIASDFFFTRPAFRRADGLRWRLELWFQVLQRLARLRLGRRAPIKSDFFFFSRPAFRRADGLRWRLEPVVSSVAAAGAAPSWTSRPHHV